MALTPAGANGDANPAHADSGARNRHSGARDSHGCCEAAGNLRSPGESVGLQLLQRKRENHRRCAIQLLLVLQLHSIVLESNEWLCSAVCRWDL